MSRICIYNSLKTKDTAGNTINHVLGTAPKRSKPVRLFTGEGELRYISYEFHYSGNLVSDLDLRFYQEFFADAPSLAAPPDKRTALGVNPDTMWAREVDESVAAGIVTHTNVTRELTLQADPLGNGTVRYLQMVVNAPWVRLAVFSNGAPPAGAQLGIYAICGGHLEEAYLIANGDVPYAYNA
jgi:hypothetical protein